MGFCLHDYVLTAPGTVDSFVFAQVVGIMYAAAAAAGNLQAFEETVNDTERVLKPAQDHQHFPNALAAAVVADQIEMVEVVLTYVLTALRGDTRDIVTRKGGCQALRSALRLHRNDSASLIIKSTLEDVICPNERYLFELCVAERNAQLIPPVSNYLQTKE